VNSHEAVPPQRSRVVVLVVGVVAFLLGAGLGVALTLLLAGGQAKPTGEQIFATRECGVILSPSSKTPLRLTGKGPNCSIIRGWATSFVQRGSLAGWQCAASEQACSRRNLSFELVPAPETQRDLQVGRPHVGDAKAKLDAAWGTGRQITCAGYYQYQAPEGPVIVEFEDKRGPSYSGCIGDNAKTAVVKSIHPR
jgi:hypothetical protein